MIENFKNIGISLGKSDALDLRARAKDMTGTAIIDEEVKIPKFINKDYSNWPVGSPVIDEGQVWTLIQPYDATVHTEHPSQLRALWGLCHTKNSDKAKMWVDPFGTSGMYMIDECYKDSMGIIYRAKQDNLVYDAKALPEAWMIVS